MPKQENSTFRHYFDEKCKCPNIILWSRCGDIMTKNANKVGVWDIFIGTLRSFVAPIEAFNSI